MMFNRGEIALASVASVYMLLLLFGLMALYYGFRAITRRRAEA